MGERRKKGERGIGKKEEKREKRGERKGKR